MASQIYGVTGNRKLKRNQQAELNARMGMLPSILAREQQDAQLAADRKFQNKQFKEQKNQAKKTAQFQKKQARQQFGLEAGKMGLNLAGSDMVANGGKTIGNIMDKFKGGTAPSDGPMRMSTSPTAGSGAKGYFGGMSVGGGIAGGLGGYGAATMFGGSKKKKMLIGTGAGMLTDMISGGSGLGGALGGLFGGLIS